MSGESHDADHEGTKSDSGGGARAPLIEPPSLRTEEDRGATRLELFFDLAYVLVVAQLASAFTENLTWTGAGVFAGLFTVTWWSWVTTTLYANRFDTNDVLYRVLKLAGTFAVAIMAASAVGAAGPEADIFAGGYLLTRILLIVLYIRAWRHVPEARSGVAIYLAGTMISSVFWAVSIFVPGSAQFVLWGIGIAIEAAAPLAATKWQISVPLHLDHLPERFGLFVILVLGESISAIVLGMHEAHWAWASVVTALIAFVVAAAVWWIYFDLGGAEAKEELQDEDHAHDSGAADRYVYGHLPLVIGAAAIGVGIEQYVLHPIGELTAGGRWALCGGIAIFLIGVSAVVAGSSRSWRSVWPWPAAAIPLFVVVGIVDSEVPYAAAGVLAIALLVLVIGGIRRQRRNLIATQET